MPKDNYTRAREVCYDIFLVSAGLSLLALVVHLILMPFPAFPAPNKTGAVPVQISWFDEVRAWSELIFYWAGSLLLIVALIGLRQIGIAKSDVSIRNERAAKEKAVELGSRWGSVAVPLMFETWEILGRLGVKPYKGEVGDFYQSNLSGAEEKRIRDAIWDNPVARHLVIRLATEIETISASCLSGVADENLGFRTYLKMPP